MQSLCCMGTINAMVNLKQFSRIVLICVENYNWPCSGFAMVVAAWLWVTCASYTTK